MLIIAGIIKRYLRIDSMAFASNTIPQPVPSNTSFWQIVKVTLTHPPILCLAIIFACYTSQWITVTGFLPSMYVEHGIDLKVAGVLVSIVVLANLGGTFGAGMLLQRGWKPKTLFSTGFTAMLCSSFLAFAASSWLMFDLQFISAVLFSLIGGIIPTTVFAITLQHARVPMPQQPVWVWFYSFQPVLNFCAAFERSTGFDYTELGLYRGSYRQPLY